MDQRNLQRVSSGLVALMSALTVLGVLALLEAGRTGTPGPFQFVFFYPIWMLLIPFLTLMFWVWRGGHSQSGESDSSEDSSLDYDRIYRHIWGRFRRRWWLTIHLAAFLIGNLFLWGGWWMGAFMNGFFVEPNPNFFTILWGVIVLQNLIYVIRVELHDHHSRHRVGLAQANPDVDEKHKRGERLMVSDDGELVEIVEDEDRSETEVGQQYP